MHASRDDARTARDTVVSILNPVLTGATVGLTVGEQGWCVRVTVSHLHSKLAGAAAGAVQGVPVRVVLHSPEVYAYARAAAEARALTGGSVVPSPPR